MPDSTWNNPWAQSLNQGQRDSMWNSSTNAPVNQAGGGFQPNQSLDANGYRYTPMYQQGAGQDAGLGSHLLGYAGATPDQYKAGGTYQQYGADGNYSGQHQFDTPSWKDALVPALAAGAMFLGPELLAGAGGDGAAMSGMDLAADGAASGGNAIAGTYGTAGSTAAGLGDGGASSVAGGDAASKGIGLNGVGNVDNYALTQGASGSLGTGYLSAGSAAAATTNPLISAGTAKLIGTGAASLVAGARGSNMSGPAYPDPTQTANAQFQLNKDSANYSAGLNRVNQSGPYGSLNYTKVAGQNGQPDTWTANYGLDPAQQGLLDRSNSMATTLGDTGNDLAKHAQGMMSAPVDLGNQTIQRQIDTSNVPGLVGGNQLAGDLATQRNALYNQQTAYLDPQYANQQHDLENSLQQQGINQTSNPAAYQRAMDQQNRDKTFAYQSAMNNAITGGGAEQSRLFNIGLASNQNQFNQNATQANFVNAAQQQNANEILAQRQQTMSELNSLQKSSQPTMPQFGSVPQANVGAPDLTNLINNQFNAQVGANNANTASRNQLTSGLFGLGAAALPYIL